MNKEVVGLFLQVFFRTQGELQILKKVMQDSECEGHVIQNMHPDMEF